MATTYKPYEESELVKALGQKKTNAENAVTNYGDFTWADQGRYDNLIKNYENRPDFSYDFNTDALYQQYKDKYMQQGKLAMEDTIGQASALTGGYGNSYAVTAGNQAYQAHLQSLNDIIPELYQLAYDRYDKEGQDVLNMIALLGNERDYAYGAWADAYNKLLSDRTYFDTQYDSERDFDRYNKMYEDELAMLNDVGGDGGSDNKPDSKPSNPETEKTTSPGYADFDWDTYNQNSKANGGSHYSSVYADLKAMKAKGVSNKEVNAYLSEMVGNSYITQSDYMSLYNKYRDGRL